MGTKVADKVLEPAAAQARSGMTLPPFGSLMSAKVVVISSNSNYFAVEQHFFFDLMQHHIQKVLFDSEWYLATYPDVQAAIDAGSVSTAAQHYSRFGYFEHRLPRRIGVDESWYLEAYRDVREAITRRHYVSAQEHFQLAGFREGRLPHAGFALIGTN